MKEKKSKKTSYLLAIVLNVLALAVPVVITIELLMQFLGAGEIQQTDGFGNVVTVAGRKGYVNVPLLVASGASLTAYRILKNPLKNMLNQAIQDNEYDEFGMSKKKSYKNLTRQEREAMDLQKMADMERLLSSSVLKKIVKKGSEHPEEDLHRLIGLEPVKEKTNEMIARMKFEQDLKKDKQYKKHQKRKNSHEDSTVSGRHMVFYGSAGTGKTTIARIMTGFLYEYGYIRENKCIEIDGSFLKAAEDSVTKTKLVIHQAFGGVLFIDEAYQMIEGTGAYGREVIATLIKEMEDNRDRFIIILAGYRNDMNRLLNSNEGFKSRIKEYLDFPDYNAEEMEKIFELMAKEQNFIISQSAMEHYRERIAKERKLSTFGNGRTARNILDEAIGKHAVNYGNGKLNCCDKNGYYIAPESEEAKNFTPVSDNKFLICGIDVNSEINQNVLD